LRYGSVFSDNDESLIPSAEYKNFSTMTLCQFVFNKNILCFMASVGTEDENNILEAMNASLAEFKSGSEDNSGGVMLMFRYFG
jgi:hypothetical protein